MTASSEGKRVVIIDRQKHWRDLFAQSLGSAGFSVSVLDDYNYPQPDGASDETPPDLVILGCARIGADEQSLISQILQHKDNLLVLCTALPWNVMRSLFLTGASDVAEKSFNREHLVKVASQALDRASPSDSYRMAKERDTDE